jgi:uncharacterized protein involved in exopolysaccharide biosynthesis
MEEGRSIELIDYLRVLWRWKWFIILFTLCCGAVAGIISFSQDRVYEVSMIIEPGVIDIDRNGNFIYLDSPSNIESKINSQAYNTRIIKQLDANAKQLRLKFKTVQPRHSNTIKIWLELRNANRGVQALSALFRILVEEYQHYTHSRKSELDQQSLLIDRQLALSEVEKTELEKEIAGVQANTNRIIEERNALISRGGNNVDKLTLLIYSNIIQQNIAHSNSFKKQLADLKANIERMKSELETLKIKKQSIENIKLIQAPQVSPYPLKQEHEVKIVLALVLGFLVSIFIAFFVEYLRRMGVVGNPPNRAVSTASAKSNAP